MSSQDPADVIARALVPSKGLEPVDYQRMLAERVMADLTEAGFVVIPDPDASHADPAAIRALVEAATFDEYGRAILPTEATVLALAWECPSCRPDVGWPERAMAHQRYPGEAESVSVICGHCGYEPMYDLQGNQVD